MAASPEQELLWVATDPDRPCFLPMPEMAWETVVDGDTGEVLCEAGRVQRNLFVPGVRRRKVIHLGVVISR